MIKGNCSEKTKRIVIFLFIEILLVILISIPLFLLKAESGGTLVMTMSIIFMWLPAITTLLTRKITHDKSNLLLKPRLKKNLKFYFMSCFVPSILIIIGTLLYFIIFPNDLDLTLGYVKNLAATTGQQINLPPLTVPSLFFVAIGLVVAAPFVLVNHILAFGEEIGWRAYLLPLLCEKLGVVKGILVDGVLWGIVHAPLVYFGVNYSGNYFGSPWSGMLMMTLFATAVGTFLSYLTIKTKSIMPACIAHGVTNAVREAPLFICVPTCSALLGPKPAGIIGMTGFIIFGVIILIKIDKNVETIDFEFQD